MLTHIVTPSNRGLYQRQLEEMHRQRRKVFVEHMGWTALDNGSPLEIDEYDHEHASYLLLLGDLGEVLASCRATPTWKPHLFETLTGYVDKLELAHGPGIWEISRWIGGPGKDEETDMICRMHIMTALGEFALSHHIDAFVGCLELTQINLMAEVGIPFDLLGEPKGYDEGTAVALRVPAGAERLDYIRKLFGIDRPVTVMAPAWTSDRPVDPKVFAIVERAFEAEDADEIEQFLEAMDQVSTRRWAATGIRPSMASLLDQPKGDA